MYEQGGITSKLKNVKCSVLIDNANLERGEITDKSRIKFQLNFLLDSKTKNIFKNFAWSLTLKKQKPFYCALSF